MDLNVGVKLSHSLPLPPISLALSLFSLSVFFLPLPLSSLPLYHLFLSLSLPLSLSLSLVLAPAAVSRPLGGRWAGLAQLPTARRLPMRHTIAAVPVTDDGAARLASMAPPALVPPAAGACHQPPSARSSGPLSSLPPALSK